LPCAEPRGGERSGGQRALPARHRQAADRQFYRRPVPRQYNAAMSASSYGHRASGEAIQHVLELHDDLAEHCRRRAEKHISHLAPRQIAA
jgi:hypothetical protein